ncbi:MAG: hypothetical protein ABIL20_09320 [candidate division WOR-3 bacterium]
MGGTSLLLDNAGIPRLCYYRASSESVHCLKYAWCEDSIWFTEIVDDTNDVGGYCSIALDDEDYLHISYVDWTNQALKYAIAPINDIVVSPSGINFGYVANNQTSEENLVIRNKGFFPRVIERIEIDSEDFSVIGQTFPQTIPALDSIVMSVRFTPSERREYFDTLLIYSDDFHHPIIGVSLNGNSFEQMVIYPNPFIPSRGHNYINFSKIPAGSKIQIFSISGERLCSINTGNSYDIFRWDTRANSGKLLASGYYYYVICDINDRILKKGKFTIIR